MTRLSQLFLAAGLLGSLAAGAALAREGGAGPRGFGFGPGGLDFAAIDANSDGTLDRAELTARGGARVAEIDTDGNGTLTRTELIAAAPERGGLWNAFGRAPGEEMADRLIATLGGTAQGQVASEAVTAHLVNGLLARLDTDRDDAISQAEAEAPMQRRAGRDGGDGPRSAPRP